MVDEISMVSAEFWTALERGIRQIRGGELPWGGLQLVLCGDFAQLPPVATRPSPNQPPDVFLNRGAFVYAPAGFSLQL